MKLISGEKPESAENFPKFADFEKLLNDLQNSSLGGEEFCITNSLYLFSYQFISNAITIMRSENLEAEKIASFKNKLIKTIKAL